MKIEDLKNKRIAILGLGIENKALFKYIVDHGVRDITICDKKHIKQEDIYDLFSANYEKDVRSLRRSQVSGKRLRPTFSQLTEKIKFQFGESYLNKLEKFDIVFRTPGIPINKPEIQGAIKHGVIVSSQIQLFFDLCSAQIIGVTGTKGKGTTSTLISEILKFNLKSQKSNLKNNIWLAGNIGNAPIELLDQIKKEDWVILELSSFQLQDLKKSPNIAVVLNITSDHLDYHKDTDEYIEAKTNIVRHQKQKDAVVINLDYINSMRFSEMTTSENIYYFSTKKSVDLGTYIEWEPKQGSNWGKIILRTPKEDVEVIRTYDIKIRGMHNLENICAAITASFLAGAKINSIRSLLNKFKGLKFRIEEVWKSDGVTYYNDSASTNPDTTTAAVKSFTEPIVLIAGGSDKGADYTRLGEEIAKSSVKSVILMGVTADRIEDSIEKQVTRNKIQTIRVNDLMEAIQSAKGEASSGDVVLFSPASASFDMFRDYKDRGEQFNKLVIS